MFDHLFVLQFADVQFCFHMSVGSVCAYTAIALLFNSFVFSRVSFSLPHYSPRPFVPHCLENRIFWVTKVTVCKTMGWVGGGGLVEGYLSRVFGLWAFWVPLRVFPPQKKPK